MTTNTPVPPRPATLPPADADPAVGDGADAPVAVAGDFERRQQAMRVPHSGYAKLSRLSDYLEEECDPGEEVCHGHDLTDDGRCALLADLRDGLALVDAETRTLREERDAALADAAALRATVERVKALAESWRYKGEFGWGAWQEGHGPDQEGYFLDGAASQLRAALSPAPAPQSDAQPEPAAETSEVEEASEAPSCCDYAEADRKWVCKGCGQSTSHYGRAPVSEADAAGGESRG